MFEDVDQVQPWLAPFPDPAEVFSDPVDRYARLLSPLVSVDLSVVDPAWRGWAHLLSPVEPMDGYLGDGTEGHHSYYARTNWLGFRLDDHDRYHLLGDWRFFLMENLVGDELVLDPDEDPRLRRRRGDGGLTEWYQEQHDSFAATKALFTQHGRLMRAGGTGESRAFLDTVGGPAHGWANWVDPEMFPLDVCDIGDDEGVIIYPLAENGDRFHFVASVAGWHYRESGADQILMFYEPGSRTVLFTYDWS